MVETRGTPMSVLPKCCQITRTWQTNVVNWQKKTYCFVVRSQNRLTKKAEPRRTKNRQPRSGTDSANRRWLRRLVRQHQIPCTTLYKTQHQNPSRQTDSNAIA